MRIKNFAPLAVTLALVIGAAFASPGAHAATKVSPAETAIKSAAKQGRYTFVTFYKKGDDASTRMLSEMKKLQGKISARAIITSVDVNDSANIGVVRRYGAERSPIPLLIVLAPNGAITAGFPNEIPAQIKKTNFQSVFVSKGKADLLKALQDKKIAAVCVQNSKTKHNKESLAAAKGLNLTEPYKGAVRVIQVDPSSNGEAKLLKELKVNTKSPEAQVVIVASSGAIVGAFSGIVTTSKLADTMNKSADCGGGSCGPAG